MKFRKTFLYLLNPSEETKRTYDLSSGNKDVEEANNLYIDRCPIHGFGDSLICRVHRPIQVEENTCYLIVTTAGIQATVTRKEIGIQVGTHAEPFKHFRTKQMKAIIVEAITILGARYDFADFRKGGRSEKWYLRLKWGWHSQLPTVASIEAFEKKFSNNPKVRVERLTRKNLFGEERLCHVVVKIWP